MILEIIFHKIQCYLPAVSAGVLLALHKHFWPRAEIIVFTYDFIWRPRVQIPISLILIIAVALISEFLIRRREARKPPAPR